MYKFGVVKKCPKCEFSMESTPVSGRPVTKFCCEELCLGVMGSQEHLHRRCPVCGWGYIEACADAD